MDTATNQWAKEKTWSDQYMDEVISILSRHFDSDRIIIAPPEKDIHENTDLIIYPQEYRVAVRLRREEYQEKYPNDFTFRNKVSSGLQTEWDKFLSGYGDYFFYGFGLESGRLGLWSIIDLVYFRGWVLHEIENGGCIGCVKPNKGGVTELRYFKLYDIPTGSIVKSTVPLVEWV